MRTLATHLFLLLFLVSTAEAQNSGLDRRFGSRGIASLTDPSPVSPARHTGLAACAAPGGGLNVLAAAPSGTLSLHRLDVHGNPDTGFGRGGVIAIATPPGADDPAQGACMADGRIVVARMARGSGSDWNLELLRVLPAGGLDPGFGAGGVLTVDFDQHVGGLGDGEFPRGLNLDAAGNVLVSMQLSISNVQTRPGLASVDASGTLRFAQLYDPQGVSAVYASLAGLGPNGRLWLVGGGNPAGLPVTSWFRAELDPIDGRLLAIFVASDGSANYVIDGGRVLPNGVMVAAGKYVPQNEPGGAYRPRLLVFRETGFSAVALPPPFPVNSFEPSLAPFPGNGVAIPIAGNRVLVGSPLGAQNQQWELATYAAVVEIGATAAQDRVDTRFGHGGAVQFAFRTPTPCANGSPTWQRPVRFSNWRGRPVLAGVHATTCSGDVRRAFAARLLLPTDVFVDDFEN